MKYFTGDEHYFHHKIIEYENRPYKDEKQMRSDLIIRHNEIVKKDDEVIHLGDFAMVGTSQWEKLGTVLSKLNGIHHLVVGNHDECPWDKYLNIGFSSVHTSLWFDEDGIICCHDPSAWSITKHKFPILLCAHIHKLFDLIKKSDSVVINVGVDVRGYKPISMEGVKNLANG
jgi:calcineurin-like phosphoesterase family protein